ncbi:gfo/Idh/MocA family oxidoreductase [Sphingobacteriales bacterium UPWRP_1]|nr:hypothetical protein BVG80_04720 [Sphingobacteriales bacterium TSM_CSM]PSJ76194.1 gfo/Idh/MocA family oxidoreductase [Sphingobacteriales bacterium UPWRP_1]
MINFGIVGLGNIGLRHARHIAHNAGAKLTAVCDINPDTKAAILNICPDAVFYNDFRHLLQHPGLEVVNICTPNYLHAPMTSEALLTGCHVVCEKPMAMSVAECNLMIDTARFTGKHLFVVKQNRYNPPVVVVKKLLTEGLLGNILQISVTCFWNRNEDYYRLSSWRGSKSKDGGCLFTQCSHFIDILYYLAGPVTCMSGLIQNATHRGLTEFEDSGAFLLKTQTGALVSFNFSTSAYQKNMEGSITLLCEKGAIKIGGQYLNTIEYQCVEGFEIPPLPAGNDANDYGSYKGSMSNHDKVIQNVVDTLHGKDQIATNGQEGREIVRIIENMYACVSR